MARQRRLFFFGMAMLVLAVIITVSMMMMCGKLGVTPWAGILGHTEQVALAESVAGKEKTLAVRDPNIQMPGIIFDPMLVQSRANGAVVVYIGQSQSPSVSAVTQACRNFWNSKGLQTQTGKTISAIDAKGKIAYTARALPNEESGGTLLLVVRVAKDAKHLASLQATQAAEILPALPDGEANLETGVRGEPGYSMMFDLHVAPTKAYDVVYNELEERGWQPFKNASTFNNPKGTMLGDKKVCVMQHTQYARGCQLMVSPHPERGRGHSQVFISVF